MLLNIVNIKRHVNYTFGLDDLGRWSRKGVATTDTLNKSNNKGLTKLANIFSKAMA